MLAHCAHMLGAQSLNCSWQHRPTVVTCREYNIALRIELKRKEIRDDPKRVAELAAYFTHCNLQPVHMALSLRSAMSIFFKLKNFDTCHHFCRRLLELNPGAKVQQEPCCGTACRPNCWLTC